MIRSQIKKKSYKWQAAKGLELYFGAPANEVVFLFSFFFLLWNISYRNQIQYVPRIWVIG